MFYVFVYQYDSNLYLVYYDYTILELNSFSKNKKNMQ